MALTDPGEQRPYRDQPVVVRVLAYQLTGRGGEGPVGGYRLVTTLLDTRRYPARQLAALYRERWEIESVFAEIKTHQRGARVVLSSKTPEGVRQQIWAHLLVHHALRELMLRTAATRGLDPGPSSVMVDTLRDHAASVSLAAWCRRSYSLGLRWPLAECRRRVL
jgi:hypothetical protein